MGPAGGSGELSPDVDYFQTGEQGADLERPRDRQAVNDAKRLQVGHEDADFHRGVDALLFQRNSEHE